MIAAGVSLLLDQVPYGRLLVLPLVWVSTLAHELGHGLTAILVGGEFLALRVHADGSGVATFHASGRIATALVAAGGLLGPAVAAALCFAVSRTPRGARTALVLTAVLCVVTTFVWMSNVFGVLVSGSLAVLLAWIARTWSPDASRLVCAFLGTQLALSVFRRGDYLFTSVARTASGDMPSDTAQMAAALWLPAPVWGVLIGATSVALLVAGLWWSLGPWKAR